MMYTLYCRGLLVLLALGGSLGASGCEREHTDYETTGTDSDTDTDTGTGTGAGIEDEGVEQVASPSPTTR